MKTRRDSPHCWADGSVSLFSPLWAAIGLDISDAYRQTVEFSREAALMPLSRTRRARRRRIEEEAGAVAVASSRPSYPCRESTARPEAAVEAAKRPIKKGWSWVCNL